MKKSRLCLQALVSLGGQHVLLPIRWCDVRESWRSQPGLKLQERVDRRDKDIRSDFPTQSRTLCELRRNVMAQSPQRLNVMGVDVPPSGPPECDAVGHTTPTTFPHNVLPAVPDSRPQQRQATALLTCEYIGQATHKSGPFPLPLID